MDREKAIKYIHDMLRMLKTREASDLYLAAGAPPKRSTQLVIVGEAEPYGGGDRPPNRVRWAFQRLGQVGGA